MAGILSKGQSEQLSRTSIKNLIEKYNLSKGQDKQTLSMLIEQLAKTPLYFAVKKGSDKTSKSLSFVTLKLGDQVFMPIFTGPEEFGKLKDAADAVCIEPENYFKMLSDNNSHAVINPFTSYFLLWPELVRDHLIPFLQQKTSFKELKQ